MRAKRNIFGKGELMQGSEASRSPPLSTNTPQAKDRLRRIFVSRKPRVVRMAKNMGLCSHMKNHPLGGWMIINSHPKSGLPSGWVLLYQSEMWSRCVLKVYLINAVVFCHVDIRPIIRRFRKISQPV